MSIGETVKEMGLDVRDAVINPKGIQNPKNLSKVCQVAKVVTVALAILTVASALFAGPLALFFGALFAGVMYDGYKMASNIQNIAEAKLDADRNSTVLETYENFKEQLNYDVTKGTIFAKLITGFIPDENFEQFDKNFYPSY